MDDYYDLLGVEPGAETADIKSAYRDKKAALDAKGDKSAVARVNRAWNVLSDPYQRGRYDEQRETAVETGELEPASSVVTDDAPPPRRRGLFQPPGDRPPPSKPTIEPPEGMTTAPQRKRVAAMLIDLLPLTIAFFLVYFVLVNAALEARHPDEKAAYDAKIDELDVATDQADDLDQTADDAEDEVDQLTEEGASAADIEAAETEAESARQDADDAKDEADRISDEAEDIQGELFGTSVLVIESFFVFGLLYLVVPSALTGQTLGKKIMGIRVIRTDGSKLGWAGAFTRYGLIVGAANLLFMLLQVLAAAIVLMLVLGWMRNPNKQGMHDRFAKTLVVEADSKSQVIDV
jgi:uncharacterized RDD family membrane protein YckC